MFNQNISFEKKTQIVDSLITKKKEAKEKHLYIYYTYYANWLSKNKKITRAIIEEKKSFKNIESTINDSLLLQKSALFLGYFYRKNKQFDKSIEFYNLALRLSDDMSNSIKIYKQLGFVYKNLYDNVRSIYYFELAYNLAIKNECVKDIRSLSINIGLVCQRIHIKSYLNKGVYYCRVADSINQFFPASNRLRYVTKITLASNYIELLEVNKASKYLKEALVVAKKNKDKNRIVQLNILLGNLYNFVDKKKSLKYLMNALSVTNKDDNDNLYDIFYNLNLSYAFSEDYINSISFGQKSIEHLFIEDSIKDIKQLTNELLIKSKEKTRLLRVLPNLAQTYLKYYEKTKDPKLLAKSILYFKKADYIIDLLRINSTEHKSKLFWREISTDLYGKAIKACYLDNNIKDALFFMEKNKALLLMEDISTNNYKQSLTISSKLLEKEKRIKREIFYIIDSLKKQSNTKFKQKLTNLKESLANLQDSIYPNQRLKNPQIFSLENVQKELKKNEILIEYHSSIETGYSIYPNKEKAYALFISNNQKFLFEIPQQSVLKEQVTKLLSLMREPFGTKEDVTKFNNLSNTVYKKLFPTNKIRKLIKDKKITIVTDSYLSYLPFESLITNSETHRYLIEDCITSYAYSYSFIKNNTQLEKNNQSYIGFAPKKFDKLNLVSLDNSEKEFKILQNYFEGKIFIGEQATKDEFLNNFPNYNIIHLATHADTNDSINPWIAFYDEKLSLNELYLHKSNASLVILSGCNTTLGKEEVGEGIMSLARGFFYSGTQSIISSLWNVDDRATPEIMNSFYTNLHKKQSKSEALRNAKLSYINNHSLSDASPHYWASFILLGKDDVLVNTIISWEWYIAGSVLFFLFFFKKKNH